MGAMVTIRYDGGKVASEEAAALASIMRKLVTEAVKVKDVFVYADEALLAIGVDPIEVFVQVNAQKTSDPAALMDKITQTLTVWKQQNNFAHPINLNIIPVEWHAKFGI